MLVVATTAATYLVVRSNLADSAHRHARQVARAAAQEQPREGELDRLAGPGDRIWLTDSQGNVIATTFRGRGEDTTSAAQHEIDSAPAGATSARWRRPGGGFAIVLVRNGAIQSSLSTLLRTLLAVGAAVVIAGALLGVVLAARALRPVERMRREVDDISGSQLDRRIAEGRPDELGRLARAFNRLLARAERADRRAAAVRRRRVARAAYAGDGAPGPCPHRHAGDRPGRRRPGARVGGRSWSVKSRRLAGTISELLSLAESAGPERPPEPVRLDLVAAEACDEMRAFHPGRTVEAELAEVTVQGDPRRLGELVRILVDNALKYSPAESAVSVNLTGGDQPELAVRDHGPGSRPPTASAPLTASTAEAPRRAWAEAGSASPSPAPSASVTEPGSRLRTRPAAARLPACDFGRVTRVGGCQAG